MVDTVEQAVYMLLSHIEPGMQDREGLKDTPRRVAKMYKEIYGGYKINVADLMTTFTKELGMDEMIVVKDIPFYSTCEHHMVPFFGKAHIGYIPDECIIGISKLARIVDVFSRRLQIQERLTEQIANTIEVHLKPLGVIVVVEAEHLCMAARGIKKPGSSTTTSKITGVFKEKDNLARTEFFSLINRRGK